MSGTRQSTLTMHLRRRELTRAEPLLCSPTLFASPLGSEGVCLLKKKSAFEEEKRGEGGERVEKKTSGESEEEEEEEDCDNVQELNDLFSSIESDAPGDHAIDFSVLLEGEHAFNVEEVSEIFSDLEHDAVLTQVDAQHALCVDEVAALFAELQEQDEEEAESGATDNVESDSDSTQDAENVDELSDLFGALEEHSAAAEEQAQDDWIASLDVDHVSDLFTELEQSQQQEEQDKTTSPVATSAPPAPAVDPRIFVPSFSVRMEGQRPMALPRVAAGARLNALAFLVGPPSLRVGPPVLTTEKRKLSVASTSPVSVLAARSADPLVSETRRTSAAKRRRVNGRFVREQNAFVSITQLQ